MVDRRIFLQCSLGVAAALIGATRAAAASMAGRPFAAPDVLVVDRGLDGSGSVAASARARGLARFEFSSDAAGLWMHQLEPRLRAGPTTIEGYTCAATLFCLDLLARDYGARLVGRRETPHGVAWILSSNPRRRAALAPPPAQRSRQHA